MTGLKVFIDSSRLCSCCSSAVTSIPPFTLILEISCTCRASSVLFQIHLWFVCLKGTGTPRFAWMTWNFRKIFETLRQFRRWRARLGEIHFRFGKKRKWVPECSTCVGRIRNFSFFCKVNRLWSINDMTGTKTLVTGWEHANLSLILIHSTAMPTGF